MKIWIVERSDYDDNLTIGLFSSADKAELSKLHHFAEYSKTGAAYYSITDYYISEHNLDDYYNLHLSPLVKALE